MRTLKISLYLFIVPFLITGCDTGYQTLETGEYGVEFVKLPTFLGGGVKSNVINPGKAVLVLPWEELYRIDTTQQTIVGEDLDKVRILISMTQFKLVQLTETKSCFRSQ